MIFINMFSWIIVVYGLDIIYIWAKIDIKHEETSENIIVCIFDNFKHLAYIEHNWIPKI